MVMVLSNEIEEELHIQYVKAEKEHKDKRQSIDADRLYNDFNYRVNLTNLEHSRLLSEIAYIKSGIYITPEQKKDRKYEIQKRKYKIERATIDLRLAQLDLNYEVDKLYKV